MATELKKMFRNWGYVLFLMMSVRDCCQVSHCKISNFSFESSKYVVERYFQILCFLLSLSHFSINWWLLPTVPMTKMFTTWQISIIPPSASASVQSLSHVQLFVTPWTIACQASLSITNHHYHLLHSVIVIPVQQIDTPFTPFTCLYIFLYNIAS